MSGGADRPDRAWQGDELAAKFVEGVRGGIPFAEAQLDVMERVIATGPRDVGSFLDIGCGDGIVAARLLARYPDASACLLDFSEPMLEKARERFAADGASVELVNADIAEDSWFEAVEGASPFDAVVSGFAIHHQPDERKMEIYREVFHLLAPGGTFVNIEHVASPTDALRGASDELFVDSLTQYHEARGTGLDRDQVSRQFHERADKQANILAPVETQCGWLRDLGFAEVDCYFKVFELAVFGGRRPADPK